MMNRILARRVLAATTLAVLLGLGTTSLAVGVGGSTSADTPRQTFPTVRTTPSYDGSESAAIMDAASEAILFGRFLEELQRQQTASTQPVTPP
jgi:hypothetical protein